MIIQVDFPDHPKTIKLRRLTGHANAADYLLRLWAHCQIRRTTRLKIDADDLAAICHFPDECDPKILLDALVKCRWVKRGLREVCVLGFDSVNSGLQSARENGKKGGRPKGFVARAPKDLPLTQITHGKPVGLENVTQTKPIEGNRIELNGREEEKRRGEEYNPSHFWSRFADFWKQNYPAHHNGRKYVGNNAKDTPALTDFVTNSEIAAMPDEEREQILTTVVRAWENPTGFWSARAASVQGFCQQYNNIADELLHGNDSERRARGNEDEHARKNREEEERIERKRQSLSIIP